MGRIAYGLNFDEDPGDLSIELWFYKNQSLVKELGGKVKGEAYHLKNAIRILYVNTAKSQLVWHPWLNEMLGIWCDSNKENEGFATVWGSAACGKSHNFGLFTLVDWWSAPKDTCTFLCSTTKPMLEKRIWSDVKKYYTLYKDSLPGKISKARTAIINEDDDDSSDDVKAGIFGIAVMQGSVEDAKSNIIGVHLPYIRLLVDEMQATRRAAVEARSNLSKGTSDFRFFGLGNPMSKLDVLGEFSEPIEGWEAVNVTTGKWKTKYGMCYHFDGFNSPGTKNPSKYPFLITQKQIDKDIKDYGSDSRDVWTMCRGFVPPEGLQETVITESMLTKFKMREKVTWEGDFQTVAGLDPAFSSGGDRCILQVARVGRDDQGEMVIQFLPHIQIKLKLSADEPIIYQVAKDVTDYADKYGFDPEYLAVDDSGVQSVADVLDHEWKRGCIRVQFGGKPSDRPVSRLNRKNCREEYRNKVTELWYTIAEFARYSQIRGVSLEASKELTQRKVLATRPKQLQPKKEMKSEYGISPDIADAMACVIEVVRTKLGLHPGSNQQEAGMFGMSEDQLYRDFDIDADASIYTEDAVV